MRKLIGSYADFPAIGIVSDTDETGSKSQLCGMLWRRDCVLEDFIMNNLSAAFGALKDPVLVLAAFLGALLIYNSRPPESREHSSIELAQLTIGVASFLFAICYAHYITNRGAPTNAHERQILRTMKEMLEVDRQQRNGHGNGTT